MSKCIDSSFLVLMQLHNIKQKYGKPWIPNSSVKALELKPHGHVWIIQNFRISSHCQDGKK